MKKRIVSLTAVGFLFLATLLAGEMTGGCGGGGGGGGGAEPTEGSDLNDSWDVEEITCEGTVTGGTFADVAGSGAQVVVTDGTITPCVNATETPTLEVSTSVPNGFDLRTGEGNTNVTQGGAGYLFDLHGDRGAVSTNEGAIVLALPFDTTLVPLADRTSLKVFVRLYNHDDNSVLNVTGTISGGTITADLRELPTRFTAAVIYNPNMAAAESISVAAASLVVSDGTKAAATSWPAQKWCVIYNTQSTAVQSALGSAVAATLQTLMKAAVSNMAANVQGTYQTAGFAAPSMYTASTAADPCGDTLGTDKRYLVHIDEVGTHYTYSEDPTKSSDEIFYGRINIQPIHLSSAATNGVGDTGSVKAAFAHELLHSIQRTYGLSKPGNRTMQGYIEGTATTYGMTIDQGGAISVRTASTDEIYILSDFLMTNLRTTISVPAWGAYANQDFFAYVGSQYNGGSLDYLVDLFQEMQTAIEVEAQVAADSAVADNIRYQPSRSLLLGAMDTAFQDSFGSTLEEVYLDFLEQRVFSHNTASRFGRPGETTSGFAQDLFSVDASDATKNAVMSVMINPDDCSVTDGSGGFGGVAPFAARAIMISPTNAASSTTLPTVSVTLTPASGSIGDSWDGFAYRSGSAQSLSAGTNTFASFGAAATDRIVIAAANVMQEGRTSFTFEATCDGAGGGGGASSDSNSFDLTSFTVPGPGLSPAWVFTMPDFGSGVIDAAIASTTDMAQTYVSPNLQVQFSTALVSGAGTYTVTSDDPIGSDPSVTQTPVAILYSPGTDAAATGALVYTSTVGTVTLTDYGTSTGDHITGSLNVTLTNDDTTPSTSGTIEAAFDFVIGMMNNL